MSVDDYSDIDVVQISSEKELNAEFDTFSKVLVDTTKDWNQRFSSIKRLEGIILGGGFEFPEFPAMLTKIYLHINAQLNDLRSAISKEACRLVCIAAQFGQELTENLCDKLLSKQCLLKLINSGTKIMSENGHECIITLLKNAKTPKVIPKILEETSSKNTAVRQKIAQYIHIVVDMFDEQTLEKYQGPLEEAISSIIADANKEVRQITRQAFSIYAEKFQARAGKMFTSFDASVQKTLVDEGLIDPSVCIRKGLSISTSSKEGKTVARPSSAKKAPNSAGKVGENYSFAGDKTAKSPEIEKKSATLPRSIVMDEKSSTKKPRQSDVWGDMKAVNSREANKLNFEKHKSEPPLVENNRNSLAPVRANQGIGMSKTTTEELSKSGIRGTSGKNYSSQQMPAKESILKQQYGSNISPVNPDREKIGNASQQQKEEELSLLIESISAEDWATRANAFEQTNEFIANLKPYEQPSNSLLDQLIQAHVQHLNDHHYKVVIACQESFSRLITIYNSKVLLYLDQIIPSLFVNLTEGKEKVISSTNFLINLINKIYSGDELLPYFIKSLDSYSKIKYKTSIVEFMNILIRNCQTYFNSQNAIKTCVAKFAAIIGEFTSTKSIVMPCLGMILYLRDLNLNATINAIGTLEMSLISKLRALALEYAPDLEENIQVYLLQSKPVVKNDPRASMPVTTSTSVSTSKTDLSVKKSESSKKPTSYNDLRSGDDEVPSIKPEKEMKKSFNEKTSSSVVDIHALSSSQTNSRGNKSSRNGVSTGSPLIRVNGNETSATAKNKSAQQNSQTDRVTEAPHKQNIAKAQYTDVDDFLQAESRAFVQSKQEEAKESNQVLSELIRIDSLVSEYPKRKDELQRNLGDIISKLTDPSISGEQKMFEYSVSILNNLLKLPLDFNKHIEYLVAGILSFYESSIKATHAIDDLLKLCFNLGYQEICLRIVVASLMEADHPIAQILIKHITKLCPQIPQGSYMKILPSIMNRYKELINHGNPDVRKNVVFSIVDLYLLNSPEIQKYVEQFSPNHQKLISIYIQKKTENQGA